MATSSRLFTRQVQRLYYCIQRHSSSKSNSYASISNSVNPLTAGICGIGVVAATGYWLYKEKKWLHLAPTVQLQAREVQRKAEDLSLYPISDKEYRFQSFASCEYNGQIYMTPQDFLESVTEGNPRPRIGRFKLTETQVENMLKNTPSRKKSTKNLFRSIMDKGIVSYTEYLFLLCILTKPRAGYEIAFKMFDRDGNQRIDRKEFLLMEEIFRKKSQSSGESDSVSWLSHYATHPDSGKRREEMKEHKKKKKKKKKKEKKEEEEEEEEEKKMKKKKEKEKKEEEEEEEEEKKMKMKKKKEKEKKEEEEEEEEKKMKMKKKKEKEKKKKEEEEEKKKKKKKKKEKKRKK